MPMVPRFKEVEKVVVETVQDGERYRMPDLRTPYCAETLLEQLKEVVKGFSTRGSIIPDDEWKFRSVLHEIYKDETQSGVVRDAAYILGHIVCRVCDTK